MVFMVFYGIYGIFFFLNNGIFNRNEFFQTEQQVTVKMTLKWMWLKMDF